MGSNITVIPWIYAGPTPTVKTVETKPVSRNKTRLGLVGETLIGPAFTPTFIKDNNEFTSIFGGKNGKLDGFTNFPRYELPFIADSFLNSSESLFVTRVLGLSGYDAGYTWGIVLESSYDRFKVGPTVTGGSYTSLFRYTADSNNVVTKLVSSDSLLQTLWDGGYISSKFNNLNSIAINGFGQLNDLPYNMYRLGSIYTGISINNFYLKSSGSIPNTTNFSGETSGVTVYYSSVTYNDIEDVLIATIKSKANYGEDENLTFNISGGISSLSFDTTVSGATNNVYGNFKLNWVTNSGVTGSVTCNLDTIGAVLSKNGNNNYPIYVEDLYDSFVRNSTKKIKGIKLSLIKYSDKFSNYKEKFKPSVTPWVVSNIISLKMFKLFRFWSVGDGEYTTNLFKVTISNIRLGDSTHVDYDVNKPDEKWIDDYKFNVIIRPINELDSSVKGFENEVYLNCSMNPKSSNYIGKMIGTRNGDYLSKSKYVTVEINEDDNLTLLVPSGFLGYPKIDYEDTVLGVAKSPYPLYNTFYEPTDNVNNNYLGFSDKYLFDKSMFKYHGLPYSTTINEWTGMTKGFHMDINASASTVDNIVYQFEVGDSTFEDEQFAYLTSYKDLNTRKFTLLPYGGFDGWDYHRIGRTNLDTFTLNGIKGILGEISNNFDKITLTDNSVGLTSDYYAFLEGINTFKNTDYININLFATPGIDNINHTKLTAEAIDLIEFKRQDSLYIMTTPDVDSAGDILNVEDVVTFIEGEYDTTYAATYWPWVQLTERGIWLPPTVSVVTSMAKNDNSNTSFLWYAVAGMDRGAFTTYDIRKNELDNYVSKTENDYLYTNRINPLIYTKLKDYEGFKIWGNKTISTAGYLTNRVHVRRLLLEIRDIIIRVCKYYLFEQNDSLVKRLIENVITEQLTKIRDNNGIKQFKIKFDTTTDEMDKGQLNGKIFIKPVNAIEYIVFIFTVSPKEGQIKVEFNPD